MKQRAARLSSCGRYRYTLSRRWGMKGRPLLWVMLNPSTADAEQDDATIRRVTRFSQNWGYPGLVVCNLFAWRATDPRELLRVAPNDDVVGPRNDYWLGRSAATCGCVVVAWGAYGAQHSARVGEVLHLLRKRPLYCLGHTKNFQPAHPLRLPADTPLTPFQAGRRLTD